DAHGGEVEHSLDAGFGQGVVILLGGFGGDGEDADLGSGFADDVGEIGGGEDGEAAPAAADLLRVVVHSRHAVEGAVIESQILGEGAAEVAHAHDHHGVLTVQAEEGIEVLGQGV